MALFSTLLFFILGLFSGVFADVCKPSTTPYKGPKLPTIPDQFTVDVSVSKYGIGKKGFSNGVVDHLYVDSKRKIAVIANGRKRVIFDQNRKQALQIDNRECNVSDISDASVDALKPYGNNNFISGNEFFRFGEKYHPVFAGQQTLGKNRVDAWRECLPALGKGNNFSIEVQYLFGNDSKIGRYFFGFMTRSASNVSIMAPMSNWDLEAPKSFKLQVPDDVFCNMSATSYKLPKVPDEFEMNIEILMSRNKSGFNVRDYIDSKEKYFRSDHHHKENGVYVPVHEIHDYNTGLSYMINSKTFSCEVSPLTNRSWDNVETDDHHHIRMRTANEFMGLDHSDYIYEGYTNVRGVSAEIFSRLRPSMRHPGEMMIQKWYFSRPEWKIGGMEGPLDDRRVPVMLKFIHKDRQSVMNFFNYDPIETSSHILWPLSTCFKSNRHYMYFRLSGQYDSYGVENQRSITNAIRDSLSTVGNISKLRVSSVLIFKSGYGGVVAVRVYVLGVPPVKGTVLVLHPKHEVPLKDAVDRIRDSITTGNLAVTFKIQDNGQWKTVTLNAQKKSYYDQYVDGPDPLPPSKKRKEGKPGMTGGAVAAISIALIVVAVLLTVTLLHFILKRHGVQLFGYSRHSDEPTA